MREGEEYGDVVQRRQVSRTVDSHRGSSTRTDGHDTPGRRRDSGLARPVSDPGVSDAGSGTPYPLTQERMLAKLNEVLQVDLGTDERTYMDNDVQWEQRIHEFETMSREMLPDIVKRAMITEMSPPPIRTHLLVNAQTLTRYATVRAAIEAFLAVGRKWGPDHSGPAPRDVDPMTRKGKGKGEGKGSKDTEKGNSKGKDTEKEKGVRFEGYCGRSGKWWHQQKDCWSRHGKPVNSVETDTAEPQDVDSPSEQTSVPAAALTTSRVTGGEPEPRQYHVNTTAKGSSGF